MKLSVNLNKIALLRNARGENYPDLHYFANKAIDLGVDGLTLHPRPDHRHATSNDVIELAKISKNRGVEFNIEGNPFSQPNDEFLGFCELVELIDPDQNYLPYLRLQMNLMNKQEIYKNLDFLTHHLLIL